MCEFKRENYILVPGFAIVDHGLSGNELLCYSLVYGFSQDGETEFKGSLSYIASALNVTRQNAKKILDRLIEKGLIEKRELVFSGVKFCSYIAETATVSLKQQHGEQNNNGVLSKQQRPIYNSTINDISNNIILEDNARPQSGTLDSPVDKIEKGSIRRTSETNPILFADSRYSDYEKFKAEFFDEKYKEVDVLYYFQAVRDWSAQKGKKMKDWIATARNFMRKDNDSGKLHVLQNPYKGLPDDAIDYLKSLA